MTTSFANVTPTNLELTPVRVSFNGVDLGATLGNVSVAVTYDKADLLGDQLGKTVLDRRVSGQIFTVTTELAEIQNKDIWKVVFPSAHEVTSGGNKMIYFDAQIGDADSLHSSPLILHPLSKDNADLSGDFKFFKACADSKSSIVYGPTEQAKLKIVWQIYPDFTTEPARFMIYGDPSIGLINAAHGSPVLVGTGNGTMGSISVFNGFTKTETITAQCVTAASDGGIFYVSGSLSGPLGLATVGVGFSVPEVAFTISDGSSDFIVGDTFTMTTTAANYV